MTNEIRLIDLETEAGRQELYERMEARPNAEARKKIAEFRAKKKQVRIRTVLETKTRPLDAAFSRLCGQDQIRSSHSGYNSHR